MRVQSRLFITAMLGNWKPMRISGDWTENQEICRLVLVPNAPGEAVTLFLAWLPPSLN